MSDDQQPVGKSTNINMSVAPYEKAIDTIAKGVVNAADGFLSKVCLPALEEVGGMVADRFKYWRAGQRANLLRKWEAKMIEQGREGMHAPPRLIATGLERGSLVDSEDLCDMWAGLLASSCTPDGIDDSNLLFMNILDQLTIPEAKIIGYACEHAEKKLSSNGLVFAEHLNVDLETLIEISGIDDIERLDRELDHLRSIDILVSGGFSLDRYGAAGGVISKPTVAVITPSPVAIHFFVRCQGSLKTATEYFGLVYTPPAEPEMQPAPAN